MMTLVINDSRFIVATVDGLPLNNEGLYSELCRQIATFHIRVADFILIIDLRNSEFYILKDRLYGKTTEVLPIDDITEYNTEYLRRRDLLV